MSRLKQIVGKSLAHTIEVAAALAVFLIAGYAALNILGLDVKAELIEVLKMLLMGLPAVAAAKAYRVASGNDYINER